MSSTPYFLDASNAIVANCKFMVVGGNLNFGGSERHGLGLKLLLRNISTGAFHDAAERGDPPKCHPHTRLAIRAEIMQWVKAPGARRKSIMWMYGPAGSGKTAIAQSIAEECMMQGLLAASFFFGRSIPGRNDTTRVVATIAYQISRRFPHLEDHLRTVIERDPTIFSRSLATQMQVFVVGPLKAFPPLAQPIFAILDGLDEAGPTPQDQANLLDVIGTALAELQHIPLILLIASRPEYAIREAFNRHLRPLTQSLVLDDDYKPDEDIKLYLTSALEEIHDKHVQIGTHLPSPWPSQSDVDRLMSKASGQFIFAKAVLKFIDSIQHNPDKRLSIILGLSSAGHETPFALLDALYHSILSSVAEREEVLAILRVLLFQDGAPLLVEEIEELLGFEVRRILVDMHALVFVPQPSDDTAELRIHHASLYDFLMDPSRSYEFYIDAGQAHLDLTKRWWNIISNFKYARKLRLDRCMQSFIYHYKKSPGRHEFTNDLSRFDLKRHLEEYTSLRAFYYSPWNEFFECINQQAKDQPNWHSDVPILENALRAFVLERISKYPPALQTYIPAVLSLSSLVSNEGDIFRLLLCGLDQSVMECNEIHRLDAILLHLDGLLYVDRVFLHLFHREENYLALAKQIVGIMFPEPGEDIRRLKFECSPFSETETVLSLADDGSLCVQLLNFHFHWFTKMLLEIPCNLDLAMILRDRALQYNGNDTLLQTGRDHIASSSLEYIQRCDIPYLNHAHPPSANRCIVCEKCNDTSVIVQLEPRNESDVATVSLLSIPESPSRIADADDDDSIYLEESRTPIPVDPPAISIATASLPAPILGDPNRSSTTLPNSQALATLEPATKSKRKRGSAELMDRRMKVKKPWY